jgi:lipoyl(octanoyl) transferase
MVFHLIKEQIMHKNVVYQDWGIIDYQMAWKKQESIFRAIIRFKKEERARSINEAGKAVFDANPLSAPDYLIFCQHPHVFTLGRSGKASHLLLDENGLAERNAGYYVINRGGDITYHGPGQLLCYPILDLDHFYTDIHLFFRMLEEAVIRTLADYNLTAGRYPGYTGVWFDADNENARKVAALGLRCSNWVTMHGLSLNVNTDLSYFKDIVPCGIADKSVTSMAAELGHNVDMEEVQQRLCAHITGLFEMKLIDESN